MHIRDLELEIGTCHKVPASDPVLWENVIVDLSIELNRKLL